MAQHPPDAGWPSETGVPGNHVAGCPNFPSCQCTQDCSGDMSRARLRLPEWILLAMLGIGSLLGIWLILAQGGGHG